METTNNTNCSHNSEEINWKFVYFYRGRKTQKGVIEEGEWQNDVFVKGKKIHPDGAVEFWTNGKLIKKTYGKNSTNLRRNLNRRTTYDSNEVSLNYAKAILNKIKFLNKSYKIKNNISIDNKIIKNNISIDMFKKNFIIFN